MLIVVRAYLLLLQTETDEQLLAFMAFPSEQEATGKQVILILTTATSAPFWCNETHH